MARTRTILLAIAGVLLSPVILSVVATWTILDLLFTHVVAASAAYVAVLVGLATRYTREGDASWPWSGAVASLATLAVVAVMWAAIMRQRERRPTWLAWLSAALAAGCVAYAAAGAPLRIGATSAPEAGNAAALALAALTGLLPALQAFAVSRCWRHASTDGARTAEADIFRETVRARFQQRRVAGMHTVALEWDAAGAAAGKAPELARTPEAAGAAGAAAAPSDFFGGPHGLPMVLLHGYASGAALFMHNLDPLAAGWAPKGRVFAVDWPGCASSVRGRWTPRTLEDAEAWFVTGLEAWRRAMGIERFVLVGHSMGGYKSACYTMAHPRRVAGLFLVSAAGIPQMEPSVGAPAMSGGMVPNQPASPTPRPIPRSLWSTISYLWEADWTPGRLIRNLGPLSYCLVRLGVRGRASRWVLTHPFTPALLASLSRYMYHTLASDGSGEYCLRLLLAPGARARKAIGPRLIAAAQAAAAARGGASTPPASPASAPASVAGSKSADAEDAATPLAGSEAPSPALSTPGGGPSHVRAHPDPHAASFPPIVCCYMGGTHDWMSTPAARALTKALRGPVVQHSRCVSVSNSGHHLYLENPDEFNAALLEDALRCS